MENIRLIMIDMDGTLYDVSDLIEDGFNTSVNYLIEFYEFDKEDAEELLDWMNQHNTWNAP